MGVWKEIKDFWRFRKAQGKRRFDAAKTSRLIDFFSSTKSADSEIRWDVRVLRDRCRDLARNNDYAKKYIALMKTNVVGEHGIQMQSRAHNEDNKLDKAANLILEKEWREWCKKGNCTFDGKLSFIDCQPLVIDQIATEGECLIQVVKNAENPWGFAIAFLITIFSMKNTMFASQMTMKCAWVLKSTRAEGQ